MYRTILVPLDGSNFGEHALPLALSIARRAEARLQLVHVHTPLQAIYTEMQLYDAELEAQMKERHGIYLDNLAAQIKKTSPVPLSTASLEGEVVAVLREYMAKIAADLVVLTTHGRGAFGRFWLGSVTDGLVRESPVPVLIVHPHDKVADLGTDPVLKQVLLPLDGTPLAEQIIEPALALG
jgi:nucleotide-binding universal stress UspA family protein